MAGEPAEERLKQLDQFFCQGSKEKGSYSIESLLDVLVVLYDECCNSTLRRDKNISEFIEQGKSAINSNRGRSWSRFLSEYFDLFAVKPVATKIRQLRLNRNDFEPLSLIGKGAFGEVTFNETMVRRIVGDIFTNVLSTQLGNSRQIEIKRSRLCHEDSE